MELIINFHADDQYLEKPETIQARLAFHEACLSGNLVDCITKEAPDFSTGHF